MNGCLMAFLIGLAVIFGLAIIGGIIGAVSGESDPDQVTSDRDRSDRPERSSGGGGQRGNGGDGGPDPTQPVAEGEDDEIDDVRIAECRRDQFDFMTAVLDVTNNSPDRSEYIIDVVFENRAGTQQFGSGIAIVNSLAESQTTRVEASSLEEAPPGEFRCVIASVERFAF
jgi:hypothetical protein